MADILEQLIEGAGAVAEQPAEAVAPLPTPPIGAMKVCPPKLKELGARQELGRRICHAIETGIQQKGNLPARIRRNEEYFENRKIKPSLLPWKDAEYHHLPVAKQRLSQRAANFVTTVTSHNPYFRFKMIGQQNRVDDVEQTVQWALDAQGFKWSLRSAGRQAMITNTPVFRVTWQDHPEGLESATHNGPFCGPVIDVIHPDYMSVFPATPGPLKGKRLVGHCWEERLAEVRAMQKRKEWFDDVDVVGSDQRIRAKRPKSNDLQNFAAEGDEAEDANINLWDVLWHDDIEGKGKEKWYRAIVRLENNTLLRIEPYPEDLPLWYAIGQIDEETGVLWTEGSPAQDVQPIQTAVNSLFNQFLWAIQRQMAPPVITEGISADPGQLVGLAPGTLTTVKNLKSTTVIQAQGTINGVFEGIQMLLSFADAATKVSDSLTGAPSVPQDSTATEQNIKLMGFQIAGSDDVTAMTPVLCNVAKIVIAMLGKYFDRYQAVYGECIQVKDAETLKLPYTIELAGQDPEDSPQMQMEQARMVADIAMQFPDAGIPIMELVKIILLSTNLANKDDLVRRMEETEFAQMQQTISLQALLPALAMATQAMNGGNKPQKRGNTNGTGNAGTSGLEPLLEQLRMAIGAGVPAGGSGGGASSAEQLLALNGA